MRASYHFVYPDKIYTYNNSKPDFIEIMKTQFGINVDDVEFKKYNTFRSNDKEDGPYICVKFSTNASREELVDLVHTNEFFSVFSKFFKATYKISSYEDLQSICTIWYKDV